MSELQTQDTELLPAIREIGAVGRALSVNEIQERVSFIKEVMAKVMQEGQDYGKVPGCGDKPGLFQPGAQKLSMTFQLNPEVKQETITDYPGHHRGYRLIVRVTNGPKFADGVGECSTMETKYRFRGGARKCPECGKETIIKGRKEYGGGWICFNKKGGCGAKWEDGAQEIEGQSIGRVEHDNPPDFWNTVRKMAFKRAFVHAIINATNTSELWSQDLEDIAENGAVHDDPTQPKTTTKKEVKLTKPVDTETAEEKHKKFISLLRPVEKHAQQYAVKRGWILPTETIDDIPIQHTPATRHGFQAIMDNIKELMDGDQIPGAEVQGSDVAPEPLDPTHQVTGVIDQVSVKTGKKKDGQPWTRYGILLNGEWYGSFSTDLGQQAEQLKGRNVRLLFEKGDKGNNAVELQEL